MPYPLRERSHVTTGQEQGAEISPLGVKVLNGACFNATEVKTNIGILQDPGYDEPTALPRWIAPPLNTKLSIRECVGRLKPCFLIENPEVLVLLQTQKEHADPIERLMQGYGSSYVLVNICRYE